jgi:type II restriction/modification system DNA methylase subunit YeeA
VTPEEFVSKWQRSKLKERSSSQPHFLDLCRLLNLPDPNSSDPDGSSYTFERPVKKVTGGKGFADVWKRGAFAWEYKGKGKDLNEAYLQLLVYREDLGNPPLLVVSDMDTIQVHTNFTGTNKTVTIWTLEDLLDDGKRERLRKVWLEPSAFDPTKERIAVTQATIQQLLKIADALKARNNDPDKTAHFLVKCVFTLFAEDMNLLPRDGFTQLLEAAKDTPTLFKPMAEQLFSLMSTGGLSILGKIPFFNGQVFSDAEAPDLNGREVNYLLEAARQDWQEVSPAIFGTLFERIIDPAKRAQIGAHYTPPLDILDVIEPVILEPLRTEWETVRSEIEPLIKAAQVEDDAAQATIFNAENATKKAAREQAKTKLEAFQNRVASVTVLDPAMGSGNFLYMTLRMLLDLENDVRATIRLLEPGLIVPVKVSPKQMRGLELNRYAHEIAGMVLWIGFIQWCAEHGERVNREPVLEKLEGLQNKDAALDEATGQPTVWPDAEFIVGNPPFLGNYRMRQELGDTYSEAIRKAYEGRVPGAADLVCYWFEKTLEGITNGTTKRAGLIATNSIRGGANRKVLERIAATGGIFRAWPDRVWTQDGAAVRVSVVCFDNGSEPERTLLEFSGNEDDSQKRKIVTRAVSKINSDLSSSTDVAMAKKLKENAGKSFEGVKPAGPFDIVEPQAKAWFDLPNPDGVSNRDVLKLFINGRDITDEPSRRWIVDFNQISLEEAQKYVAPFRHVEATVKPIRDTNREKNSRENWWRFQRTRPEMRVQIKDLKRFLVTSIVAKHRNFVWIEAGMLPSNLLSVVVTDDDFFYGVLNSSIHVLWALKMGTFLGVGNDSRYTTTTCFETFPFPRPTQAQNETISKAATYLEQCRTHLKGKTLTEIYNALEECRKNPSPTHEAFTLMDAHERLDKAVFAAYGWEHPLSEDDILERLLALNLERAAAQGNVAPAEPKETED